MPKIFSLKKAPIQVVDCDEAFKEREDPSILNARPVNIKITGACDLTSSHGIQEECKPFAESQLSVLLKEHLTNELFAAILHAYHTPRIALKLFLIVFLLIAVGLASYTTVNLVLSYLEYGVATLTRSVYETPATFPKVTFCNVNQFTTAYSFDFLQTLGTLQNGSLNVYDANMVARLSRFQKSSMANVERNIFNSLVVNFTDADKRKLAHELSDVLLSCQFNYQECTKEDFVWEFDLNYGNCFSFNSGFNATGGPMDLKKSNIAGNG